MTTDFEKDKPSPSGNRNTLVSGLLCGMGAVGIGSKILQNREAIGTLVSDFLGRLGQLGSTVIQQSTIQMEKGCNVLRIQSCRH